MPVSFVWTALTAPIVSTPRSGTVEQWTVTPIAQYPVGGDIQVRAVIDSETVYVTVVSPILLSVTRGVEGTITAAHQAGATLTALISNPIQPDGDLWASPAYGFDLTGGTDNTFLLQQLVNAIPQTGPVQGGRIRFLPESIIRVDGQLDLTGLQNVSFVGPNVTGQNVVPAILRFTRSDSAPCIKLWGATSIAFKNMWFETTSLSYSGALFDIMTPAIPAATAAPSVFWPQPIPPGRISPAAWQHTPRSN